VEEPAEQARKTAMSGWSAHDDVASSSRLPSHLRWCSSEPVRGPCSGAGGSTRTTSSRPSSPRSPRGRTVPRTRPSRWRRPRGRRHRYRRGRGVWDGSAGSGYGWLDGARRPGLHDRDTRAVRGLTGLAVSSTAPVKTAVRRWPWGPQPRASSRCRPTAVRSRMSISPPAAGPCRPDTGVKATVGAARAGDPGVGTHLGLAPVSCECVRPPPAFRTSTAQREAGHRERPRRGLECGGLARRPHVVSLGNRT